MREKYSPLTTHLAWVDTHAPLSDGNRLLSMILLPAIAMEPSNGSIEIKKPHMDILKKTKFHIYARITRPRKNGVSSEQIRTP